MLCSCWKYDRHRIDVGYCCGYCCTVTIRPVEYYIEYRIPRSIFFCIVMGSVNLALLCAYWHNVYTILRVLIIVSSLYNYVTAYVFKLILHSYNDEDYRASELAQNATYLTFSGMFLGAGFYIFCVALSDVLGTNIQFSSTSFVSCTTMIYCFFIVRTFHRTLDKNRTNADFNELNDAARADMGHDSSSNSSASTVDSGNPLVKPLIQSQHTNINTVKKIEYGAPSHVAMTTPTVPKYIETSVVDEPERGRCVSPVNVV